MSETKKLQGKVTVITGGTTGIGLATAKLFVIEGAYVFITGRRQKELDEAVKAIGNNVTGVQGDIAKLTDLDRLFEAVATKGRIDVVFASAGVAEFAPLGKITEEHFDKLFDTNVKGTLFTVQKALALINDGGSIILNGSVASVKGTPAFGVYGATKAALRSFVRTWTSDLKDRHIRSNCGFVLQHIPVLGEEAIFESDNVGRNPGRGPSHPSEPAMRDDVVAFCDDELVFIAQPRLRLRPSRT
jgi:NAD(P)-dependent dehydrogenase (short-subunit alcohol dehydrogenase family)